MSEISTHAVAFNVDRVKPQWFHPYLAWDVASVDRRLLNKKELQAYAYDFFLRFLQFFRNQSEGSLKPGTVIELSTRMKWKLGQAELFSQTIKLNQNYFQNDPRLLPYSLFHEMVHLWLYDCFLDPGHTRRFYRKMAEFEKTGLPIDKDVHIHKRLSKEAKFIYYCENCKNRWFVNAVEKSPMYCGYCSEKSGTRCFPKAYRNPALPSTNRTHSVDYLPTALLVR